MIFIGFSRVKVKEFDYSTNFLLEIKKKGMDWWVYDMESDWLW